jgi:hypothetical protein
MGRLLCFLGRHDWEFRQNGATGDYWLECRRCHKIQQGGRRRYDAEEAQYAEQSEYMKQLGSGGSGY